MFKMKLIGRGSGRPSYAFGLSPGNIDRLLQGYPIYFSGADFGAPENQYFLIMHAESEAEIKRNHDRYANEGTHINTIALGERVLKQLSGHVALLPGDPGTLDVDIMLFAGETEAEMQAALRQHIGGQHGLNFELDPITGVMTWASGKA